MNVGTGSRRVRRSWVLVCGLAVAALVVPLAAVSTATAATQAAKANKSPIKILVDGALSGPQFSWPEIVDGATARADAQNKKGGINGHPIEIVSCDAQLNASQSAACGQKGVSEGVVADVGSLDLIGAHVNALKAANISLIGPTALGVTELNSDNVWPILPATPIVFGAVLHGLAKAGCKKVVTMSESAAAVSKSLVAGVKTVAKADNVQVLDNIVEGSGDPGPAINAAISSGADCIEFIATGAGVLRGVTALRQVNKTIKVGANYQSIVDTLKQAGSKFNGIIFADPQTEFVKSNPALKQYFKDMNKYAPDGKQTDFSLSSYASMDFLIGLMQKMSNVTAAAISKDVQTAKVNEPNLAQKFTFTPNPPINSLRSWNTSLRYGSMKNGRQQVKGTYNGLKDFKKYFDTFYSSGS